jgi:hypothetical protein
MASRLAIALVAMILPFAAINHLGAAAMTDEKPPKANTMGNVINNSGIVTQGQVGNNTIINPFTRDPDGLYQSGNKVGKVKNPTINLTNGTIDFQVISFSEYPDPNKPLEYKNHLIHCDQTPRQNPNKFVGQLSVMIVGAQCKIIK